MHYNNRFAGGAQVLEQSHDSALGCGVHALKWLIH